MIDSEIETARKAHFKRLDEAEDVYEQSTLAMKARRKQVVELAVSLREATVAAIKNIFDEGIKSADEVYDNYRRPSIDAFNRAVGASWDVFRQDVERMRKTTNDRANKPQ